MSSIYHDVTNKDQQQKKLLEAAISSMKIGYPIKPINEENNKKTLNICLVGEKGSGKSTFLKSLLDEQGGNIQIGKDSEHKLWVNIRDKNILVKISETSEKNYLNYKNYYGFLLFFDVTNENSLTYAEKWSEEIGKEASIPTIILGNKIDLSDKRCIAKKDAKKLAEKIMKKYFECSCLNGINTLEIFREIVLDAYEIFSKYGKEEDEFNNENENQIKKDNEIIEEDDDEYKDENEEDENEKEDKKADENGVHLIEEKEGKKKVETNSRKKKSSCSCFSWCCK